MSRHRSMSRALSFDQFSILCELADVMRLAVEIHTEFIVSDGDPERLQVGLAELRGKTDKLVARVGGPS